MFSTAYHTSATGANGRELNPLDGVENLVANPRIELGFASYQLAVLTIELIGLSGTALRIRTGTEQDLNLLPLPIGLERH